MYTYFYRHGDMLYLVSSTSRKDSESERPGSAQQQGAMATSVVEDEVDQFLEKLDGRIPRNRNEQMYGFNLLNMYL